MNKTNSRCQSYGDETVSFMTIQTDVQCWTSSHLYWSLGVGLPLALMWGIILPLFVFFKFKKAYNQAEGFPLNSKYSFLSGSLKAQFYYW